MMYPKSSLLLGALLLLRLGFGTGTFASAAETPTGPEAEVWPPVDQVAQWVRSVLTDVPAPAAGATNSLEYLRSLAPRVLVASGDGPGSVPVPAVTKTRVYASNAGYIRVGEVEAPLAAALTEAVAGLRRSNELAGLILDLRFAGGRDFRAAAEAAGVLVGKKVEGYRLGTNALTVEPRTGSGSVPVIVLANRQTRGAAEVLAAAVRAGATPGLILGTNSAGQARSYRDLDLVGGRRVQVETDPAVLGDRGAFPRDGLVPDLSIFVAEVDEAGYFTNEFRRVASGRPVVLDQAFRLNEAELVRRRRAGRGGDHSGPGAPVTSEGTSRGARSAGEARAPVVQDPVLGRALDLISGLADQSAARAVDSR